MKNGATILIADITGYTGFVTTTEAVHSTHIVNELLGVVLEACGDAFELAEVEGDALLLFRTGEPVKRAFLEERCIDMFTAFHTYLRVIERDRLCTCGACQEGTNLSLKFIAHYGKMSHIKIGRIAKPTGLALIVAHRLLKNCIEEDAYILATTALLSEADGWLPSCEQYDDLGEIDFTYRVLDDVLQSVPEPPPPEDPLMEPAAEPARITIDAPMEDVYAVLIDHSTKPHWVAGLKDVVLYEPIDRAGVKHLCRLDELSVEFESVKATSPRRAAVSRGNIVGMNLFFYNYFELQSSGESTEVISGVAPVGSEALPPDFVSAIMGSREQDLAGLKQYCESAVAEQR